MAKRSISYRKYMATGMATALVAAAAVPVATVSAASADDFKDVDKNAWYYSSMDYLVDKGVLGGYSDNTLRPMATLTRAEAATMLVASLGISAPSNAKLPFTDTKDNAWYTGAIAALVDRDILDGFPNGSFKPNDTVTRAEFAKMIVKAYELEARDHDGDAFVDLVPNAWYEEDINTLVAYGIASGKPGGKFDPNANVLRAESATFVYRADHVDQEGDHEIGNLQAGTDEANVAKVTADVNTSNNAEVTVDILKGSEKVTSKKVNAKDRKIEASFKELPVGDYTARVTVGTGSDALTAEKEFSVGELKVKTVKGITTAVNADADEQILNVEINGEALSLSYLKEMGYTVEFLASKDVLANTATGQLDKAKLTEGESFDYQVKVTGNDVNLTSEVVTVSVESFSTSIVSIESAGLVFNGDVKNESGTLSTSDENVHLNDIEVKYRDGQTAKLAADHKEGGSNAFTYSSSNNTVALIDRNGKITPISDGQVTFTIKNGDVTHTVDATVTTDARKATNVEASNDKVGLVVGTEGKLALTVTDQLGDPVKGFSEPIADAVNSDDEVIVEASYEGNGTDEKGKAIVNLKADGENEGTGTLEIKSGDDQVLKSLPVTVDADTRVASRSIDLVNPAGDLELDVNPFVEDEEELELVLNEYNAAGLKIGGQDLSNSNYTITSSNSDVLTVSNTNSSNGVFKVTAAGEGTAKVQVKEGSIVRYEKEVKVNDTTPKLAGASFKNELQITSTDALSVDEILDAVTFSGEKGDAKVSYATENDDLIIQLEDGSSTEKVARVSTFSVDVANAGFFSDNGFFLGEVSNKDGFASGTEGTIVLRVNREGESNAMATSTVNVDVK